jgi:hypothetical protein
MDLGCRHSTISLFCHPRRIFVAKLSYGVTVSSCDIAQSLRITLGYGLITSYVSSLAKTFEGFRLAICPSTPLEVGTCMLDAARVVRPAWYVCAELFTGNEDMDLVFVQELSLNCLIRESGNGWDPKELSRLLYRYGLGKPIGSRDGACMVSSADLPSPTGKRSETNCFGDSIEWITAPCTPL